jgi:hypothetical protein
MAWHCSDQSRLRHPLPRLLSVRNTLTFTIVKGGRQCRHYHPQMKNLSSIHPPFPIRIAPSLWYNRNTTVLQEQHRHMNQPPGLQQPTSPLRPHSHPAPQAYARKLSFSNPAAPATGANPILVAIFLPTSPTNVQDQSISWETAFRRVRFSGRELLESDFSRGSYSRRAFEHSGDPATRESWKAHPSHVVGQWWIKKSEQESLTMPQGSATACRNYPE